MTFLDLVGPFSAAIRIGKTAALAVVGGAVDVGRSIALLLPPFKSGLGIVVIRTVLKATH